MFKEPTSGQYSSTRIMFFIVVTVVMGVWAYLSIGRGSFLPLTEDIKWVLGAALGGKFFNDYLKKP